MKDCCLNCKCFEVWDGDPCCLHKDGWKIVLPSMLCENHKYETIEPCLKLHREMWEKCKEEFFKCYSIDKQELIDKYLEMFPDDRDLINSNEIKYINKEKSKN